MSSFPKDVGCQKVGKKFIIAVYLTWGVLMADFLDNLKDGLKTFSSFFLLLFFLHTFLCCGWGIILFVLISLMMSERCFRFKFCISFCFLSKWFFSEIYRPLNGAESLGVRRARRGISPDLCDFNSQTRRKTMTQIRNSFDRAARCLRRLNKFS